MKHSIIIYGRLPCLNDMINAAKFNRFVYDKMKNESKKYCSIYILKSKPPQFLKPVTIHFKWIEKNNRRDNDNVSSGGRKIILDALRDMKIIPNDSKKWLKGLSDEFVDIPDKINYRIEVTISEIE